MVSKKTSDVGMKKTHSYITEGGYITSGDSARSTGFHIVLLQNGERNDASPGWRGCGSKLEL